MASASDRPRRAYVWVWLPGLTEPVLAGALERVPGRTGRSASAQGGGPFRFAYSPSYLDHPDAVSLYTPELPLISGWQEPDDDRSMAGCLRDGSPDSWGQRVIDGRLFHKRGNAASGAEVDDLTYLLESGSNRIGALDFQQSNTSSFPDRRTQRSTNCTEQPRHWRTAPSHPSWPSRSPKAPPSVAPGRR